MPTLAAAKPSAIGRLIEPLVDQPTLDFWLQQVNPVWSWSRSLARVVERRVEAQDMVTLVLAPNRHAPAVLPGQHLNVSAEVNGRKVTRSYSLSSAPSSRGHLAITVKKVEGGRLSTHLCQNTRVGDVLDIGQAYGDMTLPASAADAAGRWVFLAAGSGITPLMSLTRTLAARGMPVRLSLLLWARTRAELPFVAELRQLAQRHPGFDVRFVLTREAATQPDELDGRIGTRSWSQWTARAGLTDAGEAGHMADRVLACGPSGFVDQVRDMASPHARVLQTEAFTPALQPLPETPAHEVTVTLQRSGRALKVSSGQSLLEALEAQGEHPAHGCRMGVCHTCVCTKVQGSVASTDGIDAEPGTAVRLCVSRPATDLTLDL